jgi:hypothetical protein
VKRALPVLQRKGECNRCGACCIGNPYTGEANVPCPHLQRDADGLTSCELHGQLDSYWGQGCNVWPTKREHVTQAHMIGKCAFTFEEV